MTCRYSHTTSVARCSCIYNAFIVKRVAIAVWRQFTNGSRGSAGFMQGHVKSSLVGPSIAVPVSGGQAVLAGNDVYVCEHRDVGGWGGGHNRQVCMHIEFSTADCSDLSQRSTLSRTSMHIGGCRDS